MRTIEQHLDVILGQANPSDPLEVELLGSVGCVLADDVVVDDYGKPHVVLNKGTRLAARHVALIAAAGFGHVVVHPKPRVVIMTVGDELVNPGKAEGRPDINGVALTAAATAAGAMTYRVGPVSSDIETIRVAIEDQLVRSDILILACGMSASDYDLVTGVVRELGRVEFLKVAMQPGSAQGFGYIGPDSTPVFVLPGNPVGALLSFDLFVRPLIRRLMGQIKLHHQTVIASLENSVKQIPDQMQYVRAKLNEKKQSVRSLEGDIEHPLAALGAADALILVTPGNETLSTGVKISVMKLDEDE
jgi:molybdopterin molybdotransferase